jgi:hypothetical protein
MTAMTTIRQDCVGLKDELGVPVYQISTTVEYVKEGDLPSPEIFVFSLVVAADPKQDVFLRIASIVDLGALPRGRETALRVAATEYLASTFTIRYSNVTIATEAKGLVRSRIDQLIADWMLAQSTFYSPITFQLPAAESTTVQAAKDAFTAAQKAKITADAAVVAALAAVDNAQNNVSATTAVQNKANVLRTLCVQQIATIQPIYEDLGAGQIAAEGLSADSAIYQTAHEHVLDPDPLLSYYKVTDAEFAAYVTALSNYTDTIRSMVPVFGLFRDYIDNLTGSCGDSADDLDTAIAAKNSADAALATAQTDAISAQAAAVAALTAVDKTLAKVLAYCPTFVP